MVDVGGKGERGGVWEFLRQCPLLMGVSCRWWEGEGEGLGRGVLPRGSNLEPL